MYQSLVYQFPRAAITSVTNWVAYQQKFIASHFWSLESKIKVLAQLVPCENLFHASPPAPDGLLAIFCIAWLVVVSP